MIGICGKIFRSSDAASKPFMTGIDKSKTTMSGLICILKPWCRPMCRKAATESTN